MKGSFCTDQQHSSLYTLKYMHHLVNILHCGWKSCKYSQNNNLTFSHTFWHRPLAWGVKTFPLTKFHDLIRKPKNKRANKLPECLLCCHWFLFLTWLLTAKIENMLRLLSTWCSLDTACQSQRSCDRLGDHGKENRKVQKHLRPKPLSISRKIEKTVLKMTPLTSLL